jgi:hypothetical protein
MLLSRRLKHIRAVWDRENLGRLHSIAFIRCSDSGHIRPLALGAAKGVSSSLVGAQTWLGASSSHLRNALHDRKPGSFAQQIAPTHP